MIGSVAVQVGSPVKLLMMKTAGEASETCWLAGATLAPKQTSETVIDPVVSGTKSLTTVNVVCVDVFTIVQAPVARDAEQLPVDE